MKNIRLEKSGLSCPRCGHETLIIVETENGVDYEVGEKCPDGCFNIVFQKEEL